MLIRDVKAYAIRIPASGEPLRHASAEAADYRLPGNSRRSVYARHHETCIIRVEADNGLVGWGEGQSPVGARATQTIVQDICRPMVQGTSPHEWEAVWYRLYSAMRERGHVTGFFVDALAGIDIAVHDLLGKALQLPVWRLLRGGFTRPVPLYVGIQGQDAVAAGEQVQSLKEDGYTAFKVHATQDDDGIVAVMQAARAAAGPDARLMLDLHGTRDVQGAIQLGEKLADTDLFWLEAPCLAEDWQGHAEIRARIPTRLATGEWLRTVWEWRPFLQQRACDVAMPDIARTGFAEGRRIAALCDMESLEVSPHVGGGGILAVAATIHYAACLPRFSLMEHSHGAHATKGMIASAYPRPEKGVFPLPTAPGLGVDIDEDRLHGYHWGLYTHPHCAVQVVADTLE